MTRFAVGDTRPGQDRAGRADRGPLSAAQLQVFREQLEQQRSFRIDQLAQLRLTADEGHLRGVALEINDSLARGARTALREVIGALERLAAGCYGHCTACSAPIELERLEILPQVGICLRCHRATEGWLDRV